jgi:hypothetical protein
MVDLHCVPALVKTLSAKNELMRKESCWALSNIAAGNLTQVAELWKVDLMPVVSFSDIHNNVVNIKDM